MQKSINPLMSIIRMQGKQWGKLLTWVVYLLIFSDELLGKNIFFSLVLQGKVLCLTNLWRFPPEMNRKASGWWLIFYLKWFRNPERGSKQIGLFSFIEGATITTAGFTGDILMPSTSAIMLKSDPRAHQNQNREANQRLDQDYRYYLFLTL